MPCSSYSILQKQTRLLIFRTSIWLEFPPCIFYLRHPFTHTPGHQDIHWMPIASKQHTHIITTLQWRHNERDGVSNHRRLDCLLSPLFRRISKKTPKLSVTGLCEGNPPVIGVFPSQRANNAENVSIWWHHHDKCYAAVGQCGQSCHKSISICDGLYRWLSARLQ